MNADPKAGSLSAYPSISISEGNPRKGFGLGIENKEARHEPFPARTSREPGHGREADPPPAVATEGAAPTVGVINAGATAAGDNAAARAARIDQPDSARDQAPRLRSQEFPRFAGRHYRRRRRLVRRCRHSRRCLRLTVETA